VPPEQRIDVRIGINLGDVIVDGRDRHGEGINIAARIEQLAAPGGICVSQSVVDQLSNKLPVGFAFLGEHHVKNITKAVQVYAVMLDGAAKPRAAAKTLSVKYRALLIAVAACAAFVLGTLAWFQPWENGRLRSIGWHCPYLISHQSRYCPST